MIAAERVDDDHGAIQHAAVVKVSAEMGLLIPGDEHPIGPRLALHERVVLRRLARHAKALGHVTLGPDARARLVDFALGQHLAEVGELAAGIEIRGVDLVPHRLPRVDPTVGAAGKLIGLGGGAKGLAHSAFGFADHLLCGLDGLQRRTGAERERSRADPSAQLYLHGHPPMSTRAVCAPPR
ncbi:MAG: hypothetical protein JSV72_03500 [Ralstonia sp.]|nr:MAG: hypothetical protein JSV72_03500 [Ralstonia sp.]